MKMKERDPLIAQLGDFVKICYLCGILRGLLGMPFPEANANFTDGNYRRPISEKPKPLFVPRRKYGARNRKFSQKGLRARKIWTQNRIEGRDRRSQEILP